MTNGEKMQEVLPEAKLELINSGQIGLKPKGENWIIWFDLAWWKKEYDENQKEKR